MGYVFITERWEKRLPFYYGWIIFSVTFLIYMFMYGLRYSVGIFFEPIRNEFDWTNAMTVSGVTIFFWVYAFTAPIMGQLARRIGVRKTVLIGGLLLGGGGVMLSYVRTLWQLYFAWGLVAATGSAALYVVPTMVLSKFFYRKRGSTVGWSSVGVSAGQALIIPWIAGTIPVLGWRSSMLMLGLLVIFSTSILGYFFLREDPTELGLQVDGDATPQEYSQKNNVKTDWDVNTTLRNLNFRLVAISYFFCLGGVISILTFAVPHMINLGIPPVQSSNAFGIIGIMSAVGSVIFGLFSDRYGRKWTIVATTGLLAVSFAVSTIIPPEILFLYAWTVLYGLSYGGAPEQYAAIITDYFGPTHSTTLFGLLTLAGGIGGGLFPLIGGWLVDRTGNYYATLMFLCIGMTLASAIAFFSRNPNGGQGDSNNLI